MNGLGKFLRRALIVGASLGSFTLGQFGAAQAEETLRVATFGGTYLEGIKKGIEEEFRQRTGATVEYVIGGPRDHLAKLVAAEGGRVPFDVVDWPEDMQVQAIKQGLVDSVNLGDIPAAKMLQKEAFLHPGYAPAAQWVISGLLFDRAKLKEQGIAAPDAYGALGDAKLAGHVALPDVANPVAPFFLSGLNQSLSGDVSNLDPSLKFLSSIANPILFPNFAVLQTRFASGEIWIFPGNQAYMIRLRKGGADVAFVRPKIGSKLGVASGEVFDLVKGTEKRKLAEAWIDVASGAVSQTKIARMLGYSPTNRDAAAELAKSDMSESFLTNDADIAALYLPDWDKVNAAYPQWIEKWNRAMR
jgi:putative spermidine/putrescine transport system substrate-binding protein